MSCELLGCLQEQLIDLALPNCIVRSEIVEVASHQEMFIHSLRVLLSVDAELLPFGRVQHSPERELLSSFHNEPRFNEAGLTALRHFGISFLSIPLDKLAQIVEADFASLVAQAEHERIHDIRFACPIRANYRGEVEQWPHIHSAS